MSSNRSLSQLSRQELYDLIWSTPATKIAADFNVSDVAVAKHCKKQNVPRPARGYWAKIAAGRKLPLPPTREEAFVTAAEKPVGKTLVLPTAEESLHPLAAELLRKIGSAKLDWQKLASIREPELPEVNVSKALAERTARLFHVILQGVEPIGIFYRKGQSSYGGGHFRKGSDRLYLKIEEKLIEKPHEVGGRKRSYSTWQQRENSKIPSGQLSFSLNPDSYGIQNAKQWAEGESLSLEQILARIVTEIRHHFSEAQKRRAQEVIDREKYRIESERRQQEYAREQAIRQMEEQKRKHAKSLETARQSRQDDLLKAAEWWRLHQVAAEFIEACEQRWRTEQGGTLKLEQNEWLQWARATSAALSPFEMGYPEPGRDGAFDESAVPFEGPYPETRNFPRPSSMPEIPAPVIVKSDQSMASNYSPPQQYPFWLKHPHR